MIKILVPVDFTSISENGLNLATDLARRTNADLYIVNFLSEPYQSSFTVTGDTAKKVDDEQTLYHIEMIKASQKRLLALADEYNQEGVNLHHQVYKATFKEGLNKFVEENGIDLIVMGTSGEQSFEEKFTGNHVEQAMELTSCPVISVKGLYDIENFNRIVVAIDDMPENDPNRHLVFLKIFCEAIDAKLHLVHVASEDTLLMEFYEHEKRLHRIALNNGINNYTVSILPSSDVEKAIVKFARKINAGLIGVLKQNQAGFFRFFTSQLSDDMVKSTDMPVITFNFTDN
ncbi:MAG: universal stress protein [Cyclobacteriaceae bacterium]